MPPFNFTDLIVPTVGGLFDIFAGREANTAVLDAAAGTREDRQKDRDLITAGGNITTPFARTTFGPEGGTQAFAGTGAGSALQSRDIATGGDVASAAERNALIRNFQPTVPDIATSRGITSQNNALRMGQFDRGIESIINSKRRAFGGVENTGERANTIRAIREFTDANRLGDEDESIGRFQTGMANDLSNLAAGLSVRAPLGPQAPGFEGGDTAGRVTSAIAQSPLPQQTPDLASTLPFAAGSDVVKQIQQQRQSAEQNRLFLAALDRLRPVSPGSGSFGELATEVRTL